MGKTKKLMAWVFIGVVAVFALGGCRGVIMNAEYSTLLDKTTALAADASARAQAGTLTADEMKQVLKLESDTWFKFKNARDGVK